MRRITVALPDDLASMIEQEAVIRGTSLSEAVRALLRTAMIPVGKRALPFAAICDHPSMVRGSAIDDVLDARSAHGLDRSR